ncbi:MAG: secretin N-terminal domain-containing protein, partial [Thermoanaerobaculia bacterium]|nr:secretin N-terminal domain-containing protein [Thermoanaerobaculia bacterium]
MKKTAGWKISLGVGLLLVSSLAGGVSAGTLPVGTADDPYVAPAVDGVKASQLVEVSSETIDGTALIQIVGDGAFEYAAFQLDDPARFVLDLPGVVKTTELNSVAVDHPVVAGIRVGQYRAFPDPISRVVFDLVAPSVPRVEPMPEGLAVSFEAAPAAGELAGEEPAIEVASTELPAAEAEVVGQTVEPPSDTVLPAIARTSGERAPEEPVSEEMPAPVEPLAAAPAVEDSAYEPSVVEETEVVAPTVEAVDTMAASEEEASESSATSTHEPVEQASEPADEAPAPEPMVEPTVEPMPEPVVEPMPEPVIPAPRVEPDMPSDTALFDVANVQMEESTAGGSTADEAAASFQAQEVGAERRYQGEPMDLTLQDADVKDVLRSFAQLSGLNIVIQPGVRGTVTVELVQVPWDQALEQILKINDLGYELDGNIMRIAPIEKLRQEAEEQQRLQQARALSVPLSTVIRRISYANAQDVARVLTARGGVMSNRGQVIVDRRTNTLIIKELPEVMDTVLSVIDQIDVPEPQVMIEARIVETTKDFSRSLGIEWGFTGVADAEHGNTTGLQFPNNVDAEGGVSVLTGGQNGFIDLTLGNVLNTFVLDARLQAAESEGLVNILSAPRVSTLNNAT